MAQIRSVCPGLGDVFYLCLLLLHHAVRSFEQLRTINGVVHDTFQHAAKAAGLLEEDDEGQLAMEDAIMEYRSASQLRFLFVLLIVEGTGVIELWDSFCDDLAHNFLGNTFDVQPVLICEYAHNCALKKLMNSWANMENQQQHSASLQSRFTLLKCTDLDYCGKQAWELNLIANDFIDAMTPYQHAIYNILSADIFSNVSLSTPLHFLMGKAGHGKLFIVKVLIVKAHDMGHIAAVCGTTVLLVSDVDGG